MMRSIQAEATSSLVRNIQGDVPPEKMIAMRSTVKEQGRYPLAYRDQLMPVRVQRKGTEFGLTESIGMRARRGFLFWLRFPDTIADIFGRVVIQNIF